MNANQALWELGDFTQIAASMRASGEEFIRSLGITPGLRVLDQRLGCSFTTMPVRDWKKSQITSVAFSLLVFRPTRKFGA
jgi:hypothetical protein